MGNLIDEAAHRVPSSLPPAARWSAAAALAVFVPKGVTIRSTQARCGFPPIPPAAPLLEPSSFLTGARSNSIAAWQIAGSFAIINGVINLFQHLSKKQDDR